MCFNNRFKVLIQVHLTSHKASLSKVLRTSTYLLRTPGVYCCKPPEIFRRRHRTKRSLSKITRTFLTIIQSRFQLIRRLPNFIRNLPTSKVDLKIFEGVWPYGTTIPLWFKAVKLLVISWNVLLKNHTTCSYNLWLKDTRDVPLLLIIQLINGIN